MSIIVCVVVAECGGGAEAADFGGYKRNYFRRVAICGEDRAGACRNYSTPVGSILFLHSVTTKRMRRQKFEYHHIHWHTETRCL